MTCLLIHGHNAMKINKSVHSHQWKQRIGNMLSIHENQLTKYMFLVTFQINYYWHIVNYKSCLAELSGKQKGRMLKQVPQVKSHTDMKISVWREVISFCPWITNESCLIKFFSHLELKGRRPANKTTK